jgi:hypothetical protein
MAARTIGGLLIGWLLAGCGAGTSVTSTVAAPYDGPLDLPHDYSDTAGVIARSGSAGAALECEFDPAEGGGGESGAELESVAKSPDRALAEFVDTSQAMPREGFVVEAVDGERVLYSYDVDGRTKAAIVVAGDRTDWEGDHGWAVAAWATCDLAEFAEGAVEGAWQQVWEDARGNRVPTNKVMSFQGAAHCSWEEIVFLVLGEYDTGQVYLRDVEGYFGTVLRTTFQAPSHLPANATDTGFRRGGRELWIGPNRDAAYLVSLEDPTDVERWPAPSQPPLCE